jgi:hypothetical protein
MALIFPIAGQVQPTRMRWRRDDHVSEADKSHCNRPERPGPVDRRRRELPVAVERRGRRQARTTPRPLEAKFVAQVIAQAYGLNQPNPSAARGYAQAKSEDRAQRDITV